MKPFSILLIKILGLYLGLKALLSMLPVLFGPQLHEIVTGEWLAVAVATIVVPIVGGVVLWFSAGAIANRIHGGEEASIDVKDTGLVRAGTFLMGIFLFVQHVGGVISRYSFSGDIAYGSLLVIVMSLFMVLGTGLLGRLYQKAKYLGSDT